VRRVILASTSRYRRALLERLGIPFEAAAPDFDEEAEKARAGDLAPEALVRRLALGKARSLAGRHPDAVIIGSDQAALLDGECLGKPGTEEAAVRQLLRLAGRVHRLLTAVAVLDAASGRALEHLDVHEVVLRPLDEATVRRYVARERPLDCAGAYKVEGPGIALFERISGDDATAVIGLPLIRTARMLEALGVAVI
jgi:septum formation protein